MCKEQTNKDIRAVKTLLDDNTTQSWQLLPSSHHFCFVLYNNMHIYCDNYTIIITIVYSFSPSPHDYSINAKDNVIGWLSPHSSVANSGSSKYSPPVMESKCLKHMVIVVCMMANSR